MEMRNNTNLDTGNYGDTEVDIEWINNLAWYGKAVRNDGFICEVHPELVILLVFVLWQVFDILFKKLGLLIPKFASMMLAGLLLNVLLTVSGDKSIIQEILFPENRIDIPGCLGTFGFMMFWFLNGVKMDVKTIFKAEAHARLTGVAAAALPITAGLVLYKFKSAESIPLKAIEYNTLLLMESLTSFSEIARLLIDLGMNHSSVGQVALSTSVVSNMVGLMFWLGMVPLGFRSLVQGVGLLVQMFFFIVIVFAVVRPIMFNVIIRRREGRPIEDKYIYGILVMVFLSCMYWDGLGQFPALGAFFLGLAIPNEPPIGSALVERLESFNFGIILPLFMSASMLRSDIRVWKDILTYYSSSNDKKFAVASLVLLIFLLKLSASMIVPYLYKMPLKDSIILSLIMSHKGIIELSFYLFSYGLELLDRDTFSILVLSILLNSLFLPMAIKFLYDPSKRFMCYQKRSLASMKITGALKTLVCIHRPDHIYSMINLLEACYQSDKSPLTCYVLHLVELQGQEVPTLIAHKVQKLGAGTGAKYSENVILSFDHFHRYVRGSIFIDTFTCITNSNHMQDDICWLALDKAVTFIILPFHRTWSFNRTSIVSDSEMIRFLNFNVLKQAPCSVGILVERHLVNKNQESKQNLKVCVIFVGGEDDMETLALAKRMARQENVTLTVLCLLAAKRSKEVTGWDQILDTVELRELVRSNDPKTLKEESSTSYLEEGILDGADTSMLLRSMAFDYDLFIVGRTCGQNHAATRGVESWCEFEELGVIGDFLASPDFPSKTSVLVVQQQRNIANN
ncbi:hypothetical protein Bca4012_082410 [Brassica carinata]